jgi:hypothetical protein
MSPTRDFVLVCDDEGKRKGLVPNRWMPNGESLVGTFFICARDEVNAAHEKDFVGLSDAEVLFIMRTLDPMLKPLTVPPQSIVVFTSGSRVTLTFAPEECALCKRKDMEIVWEGPVVLDAPDQVICDECYKKQPPTPSQPQRPIWSYLKVGLEWVRAVPPIPSTERPGS